MRSAPDSGGSQDADVLAGEHGARGMVVQQPLTQQQRLELQQQIVEARTAAATYPTVERRASGGLLPLDRVRAVHRRALHEHPPRDRLRPRAPVRAVVRRLDPRREDRRLSYLVYHHDGPPPGFVGPNDHWHQHNANGGLCLGAGGVIGGEETSRAQCAARGGHKTLLIDVWMLHAWVVPGFECSWGVFSGECPELGGRVGGTAYDPPAAFLTSDALPSPGSPSRATACCSARCARATRTSSPPLVCQAPEYQTPRQPQRSPRVLPR